MADILTRPKHGYVSIFLPNLEECDVRKSAAREARWRLGWGAARAGRRAQRTNAGSAAAPGAGARLGAQAQRAPSGERAQRRVAAPGCQGPAALVSLPIPAAGCGFLEPAPLGAHAVGRR